ncbi:MAG: hypothetical protein ACRCYO_07115, partial [Bacteroidia bacterium]
MKNLIFLLLVCSAFFFTSCGNEKAIGKKIFVLQKIHNGTYYDLPSGVPDLEEKLQQRLAKIGIAEDDVELLAIQGKLHLEISQWSVYKKTCEEETIRQLVTGQGIFSIWKTSSAAECFETMVAQTKLLDQSDSIAKKDTDIVNMDNVFWFGRIMPPFFAMQKNDMS